MTGEWKLLPVGGTNDIFSAMWEAMFVEPWDGTQAVMIGAGYDAALTAAPQPEPVTFTYRNWRGEVAERRVRIIGIRFGSTEWHPEPQLLLRAFDLDKGEEREFAVADIGRPVAQGGGDGC